MEYDQQVRNRLKRIDGQIQGILRMMDEGKDCKQVITQLSAARSAIDRTIGLVVSTNLVQCIQGEGNTDDKTHEELIQEAVNLLVKSR